MRMDIDAEPDWVRARREEREQLQKAAPGMLSGLLTASLIFGGLTTLGRTDETFLTILITAVLIGAGCWALPYTEHIAFWHGLQQDPPGDRGDDSGREWHRAAGLAGALRRMSAFRPKRLRPGRGARSWRA